MLIEKKGATWVTYFCRKVTIQPELKLFYEKPSVRARTAGTGKELVQICRKGVKVMTVKGSQVKQTSKQHAKTNIQEDQVSGVTKTIVDIYLQLCAKSPTLDQSDLRVYFMVQEISRP